MIKRESVKVKTKTNLRPDTCNIQIFQNGPCSS